MKKLIYGFCLAWVFYSVAASGYAIVQKEWLPVFKKSPSEIQAEANDISSKGSFKVAKSSLKKPDEALLFFDNPLKTNGLAIGYWLYPMRIKSVSMLLGKELQYIVDNPSKALNEVLTTAPPSSFNAIVFIGAPKTLQDNQALLKDFNQNTILTDNNGDAYIILERK